MKLKPYPKYKDSGVPWLGEIPVHWELHKGKRLFTKMERDIRLEDGVVTCFRDGIVTLRKNRRTSGFTESLKEIGYQGIRKGDLVIHMMDAFAGAVGVSDSDGKGTPVYSVCQPKLDLNTYFYSYIVREMARSDYILSLAKGIRERSTDFRFDAFASQVLPVPPKQEQDEISAYIRGKSSKINRFIRNKRLLIKLLNEQKQVIINQAVTRGIDPNVSLKPSSTVFLEKIPVMWEVLPIKRILNRLIDTEHKTAPSIEGGRYLVVRTTNIKNGKLVLKNAYFTDEYGFREWTRRGIPKPGELLFTREAPAGEACIVPDNIDLCMGQRVVLMGINPDKCLSKFALLSIYGGLTSEFIKVKSQGSTVPHFNMSDISAMPILIPLLSEQKEIIELVEIEINNIENAQERVQREIELIQEYRTRLIADVVTGKIDVRDIEIPALPDEDIVEELDDEELLDAAEAELEAVEDADE